MFCRQNIALKIRGKDIRWLRKQAISVGNKLVLKRLKLILGDNNVSIDQSIRERHGKDEGFYPSVPPDIVVFAQNTQNVIDVHKLCYEHNVPIVPYGTGTGLEGGIHALNGGVCVDLSNMKSVVEVNAKDFDCTVEAGLDWRSLNAYLRDTGLHFPVDPGASASIGGMAATRASGTNAVSFGTMKQNVLNLEVVLPDGRLMKTSGRACRSRKSSAGYDLTSLFVGSEGTLGTITKICLKLSPIPAHVVSGVCSFVDDKSAINSVIKTLQSGVSVARVEYLDSMAIRATRAYSKVDLRESPTLFLEFNGSTAEEATNRSEVVRHICVSNGGSDFECSSDADERRRLWKARHELYFALKSLAPHSTAITTDVCVPIARLTEMIAKTKRLLDRESVMGALCGHVGDGNFHAMLFFDPNNAKESARVRRVADQMCQMGVQLDGTCAGEHGIGAGKVHHMYKQYDSIAIDVMKSLKSAIDPKNLMNPMKLFYKR